MDFALRKNNLRYAYSNKDALIVTLGGIFFILLLQFAFTDYATLAGNLGLGFALIELATGLLLAILFGINIALLWQKLALAGKVKAKEGASTTIGSVLGVIVTGCPACSITLASYLGVASIIGALPFYGLELKMIGIGLLVWSTDSLLKNITTCKMKKDV